MSFSTRSLGIFCALLSLPATVFAQSLNLFDFEKEFASGRVTSQDARVELVSRENGKALRVVAGHSQAWPGATIKAAGQWDLTSFSMVVARLRNDGGQPITVNCRVDNEGADGTDHCVNGSATLQPGAEGTLRVGLKRYGDGKLEGKLFGMRGYPKAPGGEQTIDPARVTQVLFYLHKPGADHSFEVLSLQAEGRFVPPTAMVTDAEPFFPFIDVFGQYRHRDWPGKLRSDDALALRREQEEAELRAEPGPADWDRFGGWLKGPQMRSSGYFRTEKYAGKWWLVDPEGHLFWSQGIDCVGSRDVTPVEERESWFDSYSDVAASFPEFARSGYVLKGHYAGKTVHCFDFAGANLKRKFSSEWRTVSREWQHRRLRHWGLNTIGNWSDEGLRLEKKTPYVDGLSTGSARSIAGSDGYWGKFPDPFDPSFKETLERGMAGKMAKSVGDPWCIGFFSDNEIAWGDDISLAKAALLSPADQPAKRAFVARLEAKYKEISSLNTSWKSSFSSWDALRASRDAPEVNAAREDLQAFYSEIAETYFRVARQVIKKAAPDQLFLGCRFAWVNARAAAAAARECDVVSYNLYQRSVGDFQFNGGADVPLMIGEFHFGALDRGLFHTGLVPVASQAERARVYADYVTGALRHPQFVGAHWFQYQDEPTTGRAYDEENYQIGFVDIADTPYAELISASRGVASRLYETRLQAQPERSAKILEVSGPDKRIAFQLSTDADGHLTYSVLEAGQSKIENSSAGLVLQDRDLGAGATIGEATRRSVAESFDWRGNKSLATNRCEIAEIPIHSGAGQLDWRLEVRVFADGAAFRYRVPGEGSRKISGERTSWRLPASATIWFQTNTVNYEGIYQSAPVSTLGGLFPANEKVHFGPPVSIAFADGSFGLISEAALYHYSGMTLVPGAGGVLRADFEDDPGGWSQEGEIVSPWRVVVLSPDLNGLVNSDLIPALCDAPDPELFPQGVKTSWIRPGKAPCTWMVFGNDGAQWSRQKWFVDTSAAAGCNYLLVDAGWRTEKWGWMKDGADVWARTAELCRYAAERNVGIILWHSYPEGRDDSPGLTTVESREELFTQCEKAGVKGVKIDFFDSESKATVEAYEDLLRRSARHHLLINFHGANKPTGEVRTWPHEIAREGIREQEYVLWGSLPLAHYAALPFTRLAVGHGDFLPGYVQERFLRNTRSIFQMASTIVHSSPFLCLPDNPEAYLDSPLLSFIRTVPVTWEETRILPGSVIGSCVVMARRRGDEWYVAVMNCRPEEQNTEIDLSAFVLPKQQLMIYRDTPGTTGFEILSSAELAPGGKLACRLPAGGGLIAHLSSPRTHKGWK